MFAQYTSQTVNLKIWGVAHCANSTVLWQHVYWNQETWALDSVPSGDAQKKHKNEIAIPELRKPAVAGRVGWKPNSNVYIQVRPWLWWFPLKFFVCKLNKIILCDFLLPFTVSVLVSSFFLVIFPCTSCFLVFSDFLFLFSSPLLNWIRCWFGPFVLRTEGTHNCWFDASLLCGYFFWPGFSGTPDLASAPLCVSPFFELQFVWGNVCETWWRKLFRWCAW